MIPKSLITQETLELAKQALAVGPQQGPGLRKSGINIAENLVGINLEAPSKKLFPVYSPLRNRIARIASPVGATAVTWRSIRRINSGNVWPGVPENTRNTFNSTATETLTATFKTIGHDDYVGFEALARSKGFEDVRATAALNLLYAVMISEEKVILGGNVTDIGTVSGTPAGTSAAGTVAFGAGTYTFKVSALVLRGFDKGSVGQVGGIDADGESHASTASAAVVVGGGAAVTLTWNDVLGAVSYNVYAKIAADPTFTYQATVTVNKWVSDGSLSGAAGAAYVNTGNIPNAGDQTGGADEFDGLIPFIEDNVTGAQYVSKAGGTLTSDSAGGISEFDSVLKGMWDNFRLGPTVILANSEQARDITKKIGSSSNLSYRIYLEDGQKNVTGGIYVGAYLNKYASSFAEGFPNEVPIKIHPNLPAGTILFVTESLPYPNNQVPNVFEIETLQEYTQYEWAQVQRRYEFGIYAQEVLKSYFSVAHAVIKNVSPG